METIHFQVPKETKELVNKLCNEYGTDVSSVGRTLFRDWALGYIKNKHNSSPFE